MRFGGTILLLILGLLPGQSVWAHGGEEHGATPPPSHLASDLGHGGAGDRFEAVITPGEDGASRLYLADGGSNAPVAGAAVAAEVAAVPPWSGAGEATATAGVYRLAWSPPAGEAADVTLTVTQGDQADLILISIPALPVATPPAESGGWSPWLLGGGVLLLAAGGIGGVIRRRRRLVAVALACTLLPVLALAHGGEEHAAPDPAPPPGDGRTVTLAKANQFLLAVLTAPAAEREVTESVRLVGRVIPDPAAHARIHPPLPSRIGHNPEFPAPRSGQWVKQGQTLAVLDPILSATDKAGQRLALSRGERPEATVGREMVLAPIDGQLSDVHIVPGEVVTEGDTLAEIIDPARLWVEAILHDISLAGQITGGTATTRQLPGRLFPLRLTGVSPTVNPDNQGLHLQFAVDDASGTLLPGMPVDVHAQTRTVRFPIAIPPAAVLDHGGLPRVWVKIAPERFAPRPVRLGRRTAAWVEVLAGIRPGDPVVVQGHHQLDAVR